MTLLDNLKLLRIQFPGLTVEKGNLYPDQRPGIIFKVPGDFLGLPATWPTEALIENARAYFLLAPPNKVDNLRLTPHGPVPATAFYKP